LVQPRVSIEEQNSSYQYLAASYIYLIGRSGLKTTVSRLLNNASTAIVTITPFQITVPSGATIDITVRVEQPQLTKTSVPMPYVATGINETKTVASAAGTSGGNGLAWPIDPVEYVPDGVELFTDGNIDGTTTTAGSPLKTLSGLSTTDVHIVEIKITSLIGGYLNVYCQNPTQLGQITAPGTYRYTTNPA